MSQQMSIFLFSFPSSVDCCVIWNQVIGAVTVVEVIVYRPRSIVFDALLKSLI